MSIDISSVSAKLIQPSIKNGRRYRFTAKRISVLVPVIFSAGLVVPFGPEIYSDMGPMEDPESGFWAPAEGLILPTEYAKVTSRNAWSCQIAVP